MKRLIHEIHRRSLWQVVGLYLAASWVVIQVSETLTESAGLPDWVPPFTILLLLIGFPIVLATAFVQEGVPLRGGRERPPGGEPVASPQEREAKRDESPVAAPSSGLEAPGPPTGKSGMQHRLFTWRNAILGGVGAFALLGVLTVAWMVMRTLGVGPAGTLVAKGVLEEKDRILLTEFQSATGDSILARSVTEAFRVDLVQSPLVAMVEPRTVAEALRRMERPTDARLDPALAREVAIREGIKAVITGDLNAAGGGYVLSASLVVAKSGEVLAAVRETAADSTKIIPAIDDLSKKLRERIGESLRAIRAEESLAQATTGSLEALRKYSQAVHAIEYEGNETRGIALLEEAVALDTAFAMAYRKLGVTLSNLNQDRAREVEVLTKAFEHRDRLTERERYLTMAAYYGQVTGEEDRAITAYENLLEGDPSNRWALNNIGNVYNDLRDFQKAEEFYERAAEVDTSNSIPYTNAANVEAAQGKYDEARRTLERSSALFPEDPWSEAWLARLAAAEGEYVAAADRYRRLRAERPTDLFWRARTHIGLAAIAATRGRLLEAASLTRVAITAHHERGQMAAYLVTAADLVALSAFVRGDPSGGLPALEEALEEQPLAKLEPLDRPYIPLAEAYATTGRAEEARKLLSELEREVPAFLRRADEAEYQRARGWLALAEERPADALEAFRRSDREACVRCPMQGLARAYEAAAQVDSAIVLYERWLETPSLEKVLDDRFFLGPTHERLGQLYDGRGELENAAKHYAAFVELWAEADPELQPRVQAAQARLEAIVAERG